MCGLALVSESHSHTCICVLVITQAELLWDLHHDSTTHTENPPFTLHPPLSTNTATRCSQCPACIPLKGVERVFRPVPYIPPPRLPFPPSQHPLPASVLHIEMPPPPSSAGWCLHSSRESSSRRALRTAPPVARCPLPGPFVPTPPPGCTCKKGRTSGGPADAAKTANAAGGIKGGMNDANWGVSDEVRSLKS